MTCARASAAYKNMVRPVRKQISSGERTDQSGHDTANGGGDAEEVGDGGGVEELVLWAEVQARSVVPQRCRLTGTFFCVMTTAVSFPLIATAVCPEPEMALKAYST